MKTNVEGGRRRAEGRERLLRCRCAPRNPLPLSPLRPAVTLVELLIAIAIIATLAAMFLGASNAAMESARAARTKTTISKIHTLLMERWDSYRTRRVDINPNLISMLEQSIDGSSIPVKERPKVLREAMADLRVLATRELMKLEMPDRWSDVDLGVDVSGTGSGPLVCLQNVPSITRAYHRQLLNVRSNATIEELESNGSAECLYLTVMLHTGDGEARTLFSRQDIGDTDGDGALEFLDGWGNPIRWVRWPAGFIERSDLMTRDRDNPKTGDGDNDHDPFDPFGRNARTVTANTAYFPSVLQGYIAHLHGSAGTESPPSDSNPALHYQIGYRLVPLIFSMGPDGIGDVSTRVGSTTLAVNSIFLDPYAWDTSAKKYEFGSYGDNPEMEDGEDNSIDNIHNHLQDGR